MNEKLTTIPETVRLLQTLVGRHPGYASYQPGLQSYESDECHYCDDVSYLARDLAGKGYTVQKTIPNAIMVSTSGAPLYIFGLTEEQMRDVHAWKTGHVIQAMIAGIRLFEES